MATYREIQDHIRAEHGRVVKTCWIADVKASHGLTRGVSPNRINDSSRTNPCPDKRREPIEEALRSFGML